MKLRVARKVWRGTWGSLIGRRQRIYRERTIIRAVKSMGGMNVIQGNGLHIVVRPFHRESVAASPPDDEP